MAQVGLEELVRGRVRVEVVNAVAGQESVEELSTLRSDQQRQDQKSQDPATFRAESGPNDDDHDQNDKGDWHPYGVAHVTPVSGQEGASSHLVDHQASEHDDRGPDRNGPDP